MYFAQGHLKCIVFMFLNCMINNLHLVIALVGVFVQHEWQRTGRFRDQHGELVRSLNCAQQAVRRLTVPCRFLRHVSSCQICFYKESMLTSQNNKPKWIKGRNFVRCQAWPPGFNNIQAQDTTQCVTSEWVTRPRLICIKEYFSMQHNKNIHYIVELLLFSGLSAPPPRVGSPFGFGIRIRMHYRNVVIACK